MAKNDRILIETIANGFVPAIKLITEGLQCGMKETYQSTDASANKCRIIKTLDA
ncbi:MAG: hypothetical protein ACOX63_05205 [Christensenellales bacterium]